MLNENDRVFLLMHASDTFQHGNDINASHDLWKLPWVRMLGLGIFMVSNLIVT